MRQIKFRAWDKKNGGMVFFDNPQILEEESEGLLFYRTSEENTIPNWRKYPSEWDLMQFTGLTDKNGKEIYFGDILQTSSDDPETDMWKPDEWGYAVCEEDSEELGVWFRNWWPTKDEDSVFNWKYVEIIGNIYENHELTK